MESNPSEGSTFFEKVKKDNEIVVRHALGMLIVLVCIWAFHLVLTYTLGDDAKLFGAVPVLYVAHVGDALAFFRFFVKLVREF